MNHILKIKGVTFNPSLSINKAKSRKSLIEISHSTWNKKKSFEEKKITHTMN